MSKSGENSLITVLMAVLYRSHSYLMFESVAED